MTDEVRALPAKWREIADLMDSPRRRADYLDCVDELEAALAVSGTLTDERIRETDGDWQREAILRGRARSQVAVSGAEPTPSREQMRKQIMLTIDAYYAHRPEGMGPGTALEKCTNQLLALLHRPAPLETKALDLADTFAPHDAERIAAYQRANAAPDAKALDLADKDVEAVANAIWDYGSPFRYPECLKIASRVVAALRAKATTEEKSA